MSTARRTIPDEVRQTFTLPVAMTQDEIREAGETLAGTLGEIERIREKKRAANAEFKQDLDQLASDASELSDKITTKTKYESVSCRLRRGPDGKLEILREDSGEIVPYGRIRDDERQLALGYETN